MAKGTAGSVAAAAMRAAAFLGPEGMRGVARVNKWVTNPVHRRRRYRLTELRVVSAASPELPEALRGAGARGRSALLGTLVSGAPG